MEVSAAYYSKKTVHGSIIAKVGHARRHLLPLLDRQGVQSLE